MDGLKSAATSRSLGNRGYPTAKDGWLYCLRDQIDMLIGTSTHLAWGRCQNGLAAHVIDV